EDQIIPLFNGTDENEPELIGFLGISFPKKRYNDLDREELGALRLLYKRAELALHDRHTQEKIFQSLGLLSDQADLIQRLRAAGQFDPNQALDDTNGSSQDITVAVRDALSHYWGGPKLTESPLLKLNIVQTMLAHHEGNPINAVRAVLRDAIEKMRPEGERKYTGEWMLYNILEMKFLEGKKVKEIAMRLSMSEADLYRKQRVAIDSVAKTIKEMELDNNGSDPSKTIDKN
ncbi:MAG: hypothetical protein HGA53_10270, partial [Anaerolineaceae bacterium]|nr:hypothetical protein [Anaerolineaceae bacterium]